jgi:hypothetical protein
LGNIRLDLRTTSSLHISKVIDSGWVIRNEVVMDEVGYDARLREIASRFSELEHVEAVVLAFRDGLLRPRAQCAWTEGELTARRDHCEASLGYTTAICYSMERSRALLDRSGWFAHTQRRLLEEEKTRNGI